MKLMEISSTSGAVNIYHPGGGKGRQIFEVITWFSNGMGGRKPSLPEYREGTVKD